MGRQGDGEHCLASVTPCPLVALSPYSGYSTGEPGTRTSSTGVVELRSTCSATLP
jgi:hypothetical protein